MAVEFRGCKGLVIAEVTQDSAAGYVTGEVKQLAPVAEISKSVETSSEAHYYDNKPAIIIDTEGKDTVTFTCAIPDDEIYALITGRTYDAQKKAVIESERVQRYFAVGYILGEVGEGEDERYVWRYKGTFAIPDETSATKNDGTDANNLSLVFTGIYTDYQFANGKGTGVKGSAKAMFVRASDEVATEEDWFAAVATPDTSFPSYTLTITNSAAVTVTRNGVALGTGAKIFAGDYLVITSQGTITINGSVAWTSGNAYRVTGDTTVTVA